MASKRNLSKEGGIYTGTKEIIKSLSACSDEAWSLLLVLD
jgi:hypothetical protein